MQEGPSLPSAFPPLSWQIGAAFKSTEWDGCRAISLHLDIMSNQPKWELATNSTDSWYKSTTSELLSLPSAAQSLTLLWRSRSWSFFLLPIHCRDTFSTMPPRRQRPEEEVDDCFAASDHRPLPPQFGRPTYDHSANLSSAGAQNQPRYHQPLLLSISSWPNTFLEEYTDELMDGVANLPKVPCFSFYLFSINNGLGANSTNWSAQSQLLDAIENMVFQSSHFKANSLPTWRLWWFTLN